MTKREAVKMFKAAFPDLTKTDKPQARQAWNDFTDMLHKDKQVTTRQYDTWDYDPTPSKKS